jgi:hypothetical protein
MTTISWLEPTFTARLTLKGKALLALASLSVQFSMLTHIWCHGANGTKIRRSGHLAVRTNTRRHVQLASIQTIRCIQATLGTEFARVRWLTRASTSPTIQYTPILAVLWLAGAGGAQVAIVETIITVFA